MKKMILILFFLILLIKPGQDQEFKKTDTRHIWLEQLSNSIPDITLDDSIRFTIYPDHNVYTGWKTEEYKNRMYDNK